MKLGAQYYRDPNPPEKFWRNDLADIAAAGFAFIGVWMPWRYVNPERGRWELAKYRRLFDLARHHGLGVRVQLVPESAPDWTTRENPDTLMINSRGQPVPLHAHPMLQLGGWPGLNLHHPVARRWMDEYFREVVRQLKEHPAILTWNVWNEIQVPLLSYDAHTQAAYRAWAALKYDRLAVYNRAHGAQFAGFDELSLPNADAQGDMLLAQAADLNEFLWEMSVAEGKHRVALVRAVDPNRPISMHTNCVGPYLSHRDDWRVAALADIYGNSTYNQEPFFDTLSAIKQRSLKGPGRWWLTEHSGGRMVYYYGHHTFTGGQLVSDFLKAFAHGAAAASVWQYRNERYGQEAPNFGLLNHDGSRSERFDAVAKLAGALKKLNPAELTFDPPAIGLLFEPLDLVFRSAGDAWMQQPWQEHNEFEQWLRALLDFGHSPNFLRAEDLCRKPPARSFKVLIAPSLVVLRPGLNAVLTRWVRGGGHLIAGPFTGVFGPSGWTFEKSPGDGLDKLFGVQVVNRVNRERFSFTTPGSGQERLAGRFLFEQVRVRRGAQRALECEGWPAVVTQRVGAGRATYITSFAGAEQATGSKLLVAWLRGLGLRPPLEFDGPVWINTARWRRQRIVFAHNPAATPCAARLAAPQGGWRDPIERTMFSAKGGFATVPLADRQTRMLLSVAT